MGGPERLIQKMRDKPKAPLEILIADDHSVVRKGLRSILESNKGWKVCAEAANGRDAVTKAQLFKPDIAILDIGMPELNGLEATRQIREVSPRTEILILSAHGSEKVAREIVEAGGLGYLVKEDADTDLLAAVESLGRHKPYFTSKIMSWTAREWRRGHRETPRSILTPREREVTQLLAEGKSNKEVAAALQISVKTVETHRANIMMKLNLHSITELVHYAIRNEIVHT
jgi:DNA-binding NarL/FixJ family response regulator